VGIFETERVFGGVVVDVAQMIALSDKNRHALSESTWKSSMNTCADHDLPIAWHYFEPIGGRSTYLRDVLYSTNRAVVER
jgi:hypothetical protein